MQGNNKLLLMQVNPVKSLSKVKAVNKFTSRTKSSNSFASQLESIDAPNSSQTKIEEVNIGSVAGLLMMQESRHDEELQQESLRTANSIMSNLSNVTKAILKRDSKDKIQSLLASNYKNRERSSNTELEEIVDEIELRMLIERAKISKKG